MSMIGEARMESLQDLIAEGIRTADTETLIEILEDRGYQITKRPKRKGVDKQ